MKPFLFCRQAFRAYVALCFVAYGAWYRPWLVLPLFGLGALVFFGVSYLVAPRRAPVRRDDDGVPK